MSQTKSYFFNKQFRLYTPKKDYSRLSIKNNSNRFLIKQNLSKQLHILNISSFIENNSPLKKSTPFHSRSRPLLMRPYSTSKLKFTIPLTNMLGNNHSTTLNKSRSIRQIGSYKGDTNKNIKSLFCIKNSANKKDLIDQYEFNELATKETIDRMYKREIARIKYNKELIPLSTQTPIISGTQQMIPKQKINLFYSTFHINEIELKPFDVHYKTRNRFKMLNP